MFAFHSVILAAGPAMKAVHSTEWIRMVKRTKTMLAVLPY